MSLPAVEAAGFAYAAGVPDAWRLIETNDPAVRLAVLAVAAATLKAKGEIMRIAREGR